MAASGVCNFMQQHPGKYIRRLQLIAADDDAGGLGVPQPDSIRATEKILPHCLADTDRFHLCRKSADQAGNCGSLGERLALGVRHLLRCDPIELEAIVPFGLVNTEIPYRPTRDILRACNLRMEVVGHSDDFESGQAARSPRTGTGGKRRRASATPKARSSGAPQEQQGCGTVRDQPMPSAEFARSIIVKGWDVQRPSALQRTKSSVAEWLSQI